MGFMASKTLLSAVELELFTALAVVPMTSAQVGERLALHPRSISDFLDTLVSIGLLERDGNGPAAQYRNAPAADFFLDKNKRSYIGGLFEMANARLYPYWAELTTALRTGEPQNEAKKGEDFFAKLYSSEARLEQFLHAMAGVQMGNFMALVRAFDFSRFRSMCDVGGASGALAVQVALNHPGVACATYDLAPVRPLAQRFVDAHGVSDRVRVLVGDFFNDPLPAADVITMGNILHDWDEASKKMLMKKAFDALPSGGAFIAVEMVIDDARRANTMGLLMSLNMLIETPGGFDYTPSQFDGWARIAGFSRTEVIPLAGPASAAIAWKA